MPNEMQIYLEKWNFKYKTLKNTTKFKRLKDDYTPLYGWNVADTA